LLQRWRSLRSPAATGTERANRFVAILLGLQRLSYFVPALLSMGSDAFASRALNVGLVLATIAWNVWLFWRVAQEGWFRPGWVWADVAWTCLLVLVVTENSGEAYDQSSVNWSGRMGQAAAALAGGAFDRIAVSALALGVLLAAHAAATIAAYAGEPGLAGELASCLNGLFWFAVVIGFVVRYLRRQGGQLDRLADERAGAQARQAADHARYRARLDHYRALHDTVLSTLAAIARGGLDHRADAVRERCARDADYVRRLMLADDLADPGTVGQSLGRVVTDAEALGLRVHYRLDDVPATVPDEVAAALAGAAQEALNNVAAHSGTHTAWLTAGGVDGSVVVRVVDRGAGFVPDEEAFSRVRAADSPTNPARPPRAPTSSGFGLPFSVRERMRAVGGEARVSSAPGDGTCVELVWPA